ncbi:MAG: carbon-nitrogen hydrolase family protein [Elusimicrobiota bacterium]
MKNNLTVCGIQIESITCDIDGNITKALEWIERCKESYEPDLVVFPETYTTGFATGLNAEELSNLVDQIPGKTTDKIAEAAKKYSVNIVWPTYEPASEKGVYNSAVLIGDDGDIKGVYRKIHPFPTEKEWTVPGTGIDVYETSIGRIGMMICYDGDFPELARIMGIKKCDIIVRPSAFLRSFDTWKLTNSARAYDSRAYVVAVNAVGKDKGEQYYYGHSMIVSPLGHRLAQGLCREEVIYATLSNEPLKYASYGSEAPMLSDNIGLRNPSAYKGLLE